MKISIVKANRTPCKICGKKHSIMTKNHIPIITDRQDRFLGCSVKTININKKHKVYDFRQKSIERNKDTILITI